MNILGMSMQVHHHPISRHLLNAVKAIDHRTFSPPTCGCAQEAWGHGTVLRSVFAEQVIALIRLWDDRGDVLSLPRAESIFQAPGFVGNFVDMEAPHRGGHEALQERKEMIRMQIAEFQRKYRQAKGDHTLARLRNIRNETLAHNAEAPVGQRAEYDHHDLSLVKALLSDFGNSGMQDGRSFNWV